MRLEVIGLLLLCVLCAGLACNGQDMVEGRGTIEYVGLEGGFYGIRTDEGAAYDPVNLDHEFEVDGLRVRFEGKIVEELESLHQWGTMIELTHIERLEM